MPVRFFFFQAEAGIRDGTVTGVQTCALPILECGPTIGQYTAQLAIEIRSAGGQLGDRSEERRVGKECRSARQLKQKKKKEEIALNCQSTLPPTARQHASTYIK